MASPPQDSATRRQFAAALIELDQLRRENAALRAQLAGTGSEPKAIPEASAPPATAPLPSSTLSSHEKVAMFRALFKGRADVFPLRWENKAGKSGYSPACGNEWRPGICEKPRIKCSDCPNQQFLPVIDKVLFDHLAGTHTAGIYPLLPGDLCHFLAVDFDDADWRADALAFRHACEEFEVPAHIEISRSGNGAHVWIFFATAIAASLARQLGTALITHTSTQARQLKLSSYDRLFPSQDTLPRGGFGNLIALPLQKKPRETGNSVFVDRNLQPYSDQWSYLASVQRMPADRVEAVVRRIGKGGNVLGVAFISEEDEHEPWRGRPIPPEKLPQPLPKSVTLTLANGLYLGKSELPNPLLNRLIRLAAFQNPEFYSAQAMRMPVWNKPRVIGCAENFAHHIALPRGCLDAVLSLLRSNRIKPILRDERSAGEQVSISFLGTLRDEQRAAVSEMLQHDFGILCAPTAFGKTVTAAEIIARRGISTLILVHRTELLNQWLERLRALLDLDQKMLGAIGGSKQNPATGRLIGEGFDHARLDTLLLAMPTSWKGTLQQYAGRLHRQHALKDSVQIYDYVDASHAQLARMWERRKRGYRAMGYAIVSAVDGQGSLPGFEPATAGQNAI